jgi:hypothetical protein
MTASLIVLMVLLTLGLVITARFKEPAILATEAGM